MSKMLMCTFGRLKVKVIYLEKWSDSNCATALVEKFSVAYKLLTLEKCLVTILQKNGAPRYYHNRYELVYDGLSRYILSGV